MSNWSQSRWQIQVYLCPMVGTHSNHWQWHKDDLNFSMAILSVLLLMCTLYQYGLHFFLCYSYALHKYLDIASVIWNVSVVYLISPSSMPWRGCAGAYFPLWHRVGIWVHVYAYIWNTSLDWIWNCTRGLGVGWGGRWGWLVRIMFALFSLSYLALYLAWRPNVTATWFRSFSNFAD